MIALSVALGILATLLAVPVPLALAPARWVSRAPATALLLWQAIALAGGLSMVGALIIGALAPLGSSLTGAVIAVLASARAGHLPAGPGPLNWALLALGTLLAVHLLLTLLSTVVGVERDRRRHRVLLALLSTPSVADARVRVIDHDAPVAYCLPAGVRSITVLSAGLMRALSTEELAAVIAHEEAHVRQRHHVVLTLFTAWNRALPWFPVASEARHAVAALVEMLADDHARRSIPGPTVARAIGVVATLGLDRHPTLAPAFREVTVSAIASRVTRLSVDDSLPAAASALLALSAVLLMALPTAAILLPR